MSGMTVRRMGGLVQPWRTALGVALACILLSAILELAPALIVKRLIDEHLTLRRGTGVLRLAVLYLGATMAVQALGFLSSYLISVAAQGALDLLRRDLFRRLQSATISFYDRASLGDVISRATSDVDALGALFTSGVVSLVTELLRLVAIAAAIVALDVRLAALAALTLPVVAVVTRYFQRRVRAAEREHRSAVGLVSARLQETLNGAEVAHAFGKNGYLTARFADALRQMLAAFERTTRYSALYSPVMGVLAAFAAAAVLAAYPQLGLARSGITVGALTAFVLLFLRFFKPLIALGDELQDVQSALTAAERIFALLEVPIEEVAPAGAASDPGEEGIVLTDVHFGYLPGRPALRGVSIRVRPGEHVAVVGRSGAGKTSALHLAAGLYSPSSGSVRVARRDPRAIPQDERRRVVGVVPQLVQLFSGTVLENLTLGDPAATREAAERACVVAGADAFIRGLPSGYDTPLRGLGGGAGVQLSAGQRQLLALARALVWEPQVLLLDEATAAIDSASDAAFHAALRTSMRADSRAVLTVAHRLSTARAADLVIVLEDGRVVESGSPDVLASAEGRFAALITLEAAGWDWQRAS